MLQAAQLRLSKCERDRNSFLYCITVQELSLRSVLKMTPAVGERAPTLPSSQLHLTRGWAQISLSEQQKWLNKLQTKKLNYKQNNKILQKLFQTLDQNCFWKCDQMLATVCLPSPSVRSHTSEQLIPIRNIRRKWIRQNTNIHLQHQPQCWNHHSRNHQSIIQLAHQQKSATFIYCKKTMLLLPVYHIWLLNLAT